jgi:hypothetical protein
LGPCTSYCREENEEPEKDTGMEWNQNHQEKMVIRGCVRKEIYLKDNALYSGRVRAEFRLEHID